MMSLFSSFDKFIFYYSALFLLASYNMLMKFNWIIMGPSWLFNFVVKFYTELFKNVKPAGLSKMTSKFLITLFFALFFLNFSSVFSFNFPLTSQVNMVLLISLMFWCCLISFSLFNNTKHFLSHCIPEGTPLPLTWLLFAIEIISNSIRPVTLMVRMVANIMAGHVLMILLGSLVEIFPLSFIVYILLNVVELFVAIIQSYILVVMCILYYSET